MKRVVIGLIAVLMIVGIAQAEINIPDTLKNLPTMKQGFGFSLIDNEFSSLTTLEILNWKGLTLEAGYNTKDAAVGVISYQLINLKRLGVNIPILDLIEFSPGAYVGYKRIGIGNGNAKDNNEFDFGISATLISLKF